MIDHYFDTLMGTKGGAIVSSGDGTVTGKYYGVYFITDTTLQSISCNLSGASILTGRNLGAGVFIPAIVNSISVSGSGLICLVK